MGVSGGKALLVVALIGVGLLAGLVLVCARSQGQETDFEGTYLHRSRGQDYLTLKLSRHVSEDGTIEYAAQYGERSPEYLLATGVEGLTPP